MGLIVHELFFLLPSGVSVIWFITGTLRVISIFGLKRFIFTIFCPAKLAATVEVVHVTKVQYRQNRLCPPSILDLPPESNI